MADFVPVGIAVGATLSGSGTTSATPAKSTTTGNYLFVAFTHYTADVNVTGVTDTAGNTYTKAGTTQGGDANQDNEIWFTANPITGNAANVATVATNAAASWRHIAMAEFSLAGATSIAYDAEAAHALVAVVSGAYTSNAVTTTQADALVLGNFVALDGSNPLDNHANGTILWEANPGGADDMALAYRNTDAAGAYTVSLTQSTGSDRYSIIAKAFKAVTGGGAATFSGALVSQTVAAADFTASLAPPIVSQIGTAVSGTAAITPTWPTHVADDIGLLIVESAGGDAATLSTPAGFAAVTGSPWATGSGAAGTRLTVFWCRATGSAMGSPTVADSGDHQVAQIITVSGCHTGGNPWDVIAGSVKDTASLSNTMTGPTTTVKATLCVVIATRDNDSASTTQFSAWTNANLLNLAEVGESGTTQGNGGGFGVASGVKLDPGAVGDTTVTIATSSTSAYATIALKRPQSGVTFDGSSAGVGTAAGAITTNVKFASSITCGASVTAALNAQGAPLAGALSAVSGATGALSRLVTLSASCAAQSATAGDLSRAAGFAGALTAVCATTGDSRPEAVVLWNDISGEDGYRVKWGTSTGTYTQQADVAADATQLVIKQLAEHTTYYWIVVGLVGSTEQTPSAESRFSTGKPFAGDAVCVATVTAQFPANIAGNASASASTSGTLTRTPAMSGTLAAVSTCVTALQSSATLASAIVAQSSAAGALTRVNTIAADVSSGASTSGAVICQVTFSGAMQSIASANVSISSVGPALDGIVQCFPSASGGMSIAVRLVGASISFTSSSAAVGEIGASLQATIASASVINGALLCQVRFSGSFVSLASALADLDAAAYLAGNVGAASSIVGSMTTDFLLYGDILCSSSMTGVIHLQMAGNLSSEAVTSASLTCVHPLTSAAISNAIVTGELFSQVSLSADVIVHALTKGRMRAGVVNLDRAPKPIIVQRGRTGMWSRGWDG